MILHSLRVIHWRSLLDPVELGPFSERLNVIHAPNGTGKSSLFEAMRRALFDAHLVSGEEIEAVRPWGRSLAPQVHVEFTQSGVRYRIEKTFLDGAAARLLRFENGIFQPLADSRNADAKLREIIAASDAPGRGLSKPEHWGLAEVLWAPQGALHLDSLSSSVTENLRAALGVQLSGEGGSRLEELLEERYQTFFTKGGKPRSGKQAAPILALESEHENTVAERQERLEHQQRFEETARAVEDARQKRGQARLEADTLRESVVQTRQQAELYLRLQGELEQKLQTEQAAKERFDAIGQSLELIGNAREEITELQTKIQSGKTLVTDFAAELINATSTAEEARQKRDESRRQRSSLDERTAEVEDARAFVDDTKAHQTLAARIEKLRQFEADLKAGKDKRATIVAPDDKTIREVRKCVTAREKAQAALRASLIHLTVQPKKKTTIHPQSPDRSQAVAAGKTATFSGSPEVKIEIEGFGTIHASGPEGDAEAHEEALQEIEKNITALKGFAADKKLEPVYALLKSIQDSKESPSARLARFNRDAVAAIVQATSISGFSENYGYLTSAGAEFKELLDSAAIVLRGISLDAWNNHKDRETAVAANELAIKHATSAESKQRLAEDKRTLQQMRYEANLAPISAAPSLSTINGIGLKLYGSSDTDPSTGSYLSTYYFVFLYIPIFPICRYRVTSSGGSYRFFGKAPLRTCDKWHLAISIGLIIGFIIFLCSADGGSSGSSSYTPPPSPAYTPTAQSAPAFTPPPVTSAGDANSDGNVYRVPSDVSSQLDREKLEIEADRAVLTQQKDQLDALGRQIESARIYLDKTSQEAIDTFNAKVDRYNLLSQQAKAANSAFNEKVDSYNAKLKQYGH